ncbi:MAG: glycosyltransferase family 39 protein [Candidatus Nealsonbacteria bacterium]|nr:glycosyltransferase family 39 protein [Candidatus Nealsonbacteria bacterium]
MRKETILLLFILLLAGFLRFWQLDSIPPGLYPDVAINGNDALSAWEGRDFKVFYPENNGREGLFLNLIALSFAVFGPSAWMIKAVAAVIGLLTVLGTYLLAKELFPNHKYLSLVSALLLATSFWHLNFSRLGFRAVMVPFFLVFFSYFLFRAFRKKEVCSALLAGAFFGLGFHTYIAFRVAPLLLPFILAPFYLVYRRESQQKKYFSLSIVFFLTTFVVALPIGLYFLNHPQDFLGRAAGVSVFSSANPIFGLAQSFFVHLQMFVFVGDSNWRHNLPGFPQLSPGLGILMFLGLFVLARYLVRECRQREWPKVAVQGFLLSWFFVLLLPGVLTSEGIPHSLRTIGVLPVAYILTGLGLFWLKERFTKRPLVFVTALALVISLGVFFDPYRYFFVWARNPNVEGAFTKNYLAVGNLLNSLPEGTKKYVIVNEPGVPVLGSAGLPMPAQTPIFIERSVFGRRRATYLLPADLDKIQTDGQETVVVPLKDDPETFEKLKTIFPSGQIGEENKLKIYKISRP